MRFTNKYNLPEALVNAISEREYSKGDADFSVTELLRPPQMWKLTRIYGGQITTDVTDHIWALFGSAVHYILAKGSQNSNEVVEQRLFMKLGKVTISGQPDIVTTESGKVILQDYKVTSTYKVLNKDFDDWSFQLNMYRIMLETAGYRDIETEIIAILRDWSRSELKKAQKEGKEYPEKQVVRIPIPLDEEILIKLAERLVLLNKVDKINDIEELAKAYPCSKEDRWGQPDAFLVQKGDYVYRRVVVEDETEAGKLLAKTTAEAIVSNMKTPGYEVKFVEGIDLRCEEYCPVKEFCFQKNGTKPEVVLPDKSIEEIIKELGGENNG